jgi:sigma-B regulation protein RsbU (phosphoserine phosphatase)
MVGMSGSGGTLMKATALAAAAYVLAARAELTVISLFRLSAQDLTWISDVFLAVAVGSVTYLWLHLRATRAELTVAERTKVTLETQLRMAAEVQENLLPVLPADSPAARWGARLEAALQIGGDFYDVLSHNHRYTTFILGDISGKGIPAAMLLAYTRAVFRTVAREHHAPDEIMRRLSAALFRDTGGDPYVTCIVGRLDIERGELTSTNAGHPPGLVVRGGTVVQLDQGGPPAGLLPDVRYTGQRVTLHPGDLVVCVTDGITEAISVADATSHEQIVAVVRGLGPSPAPDQVCAAIIETAADGEGPEGIEDWQDDRTVLALAIGAPPRHARALDRH